MFRQKGAGVPRGVDAKAMDADPSEQSGFAARIGRPVWKQFIDDDVSQRELRGSIQAEKDYQNQVARKNAAGGRKSSGGKWGSRDGKVVRDRGDGLFDEFDPEKLANHSELGGLARKSIWERDATQAKKDAEERSFRLKDPSDRRALTAREREELELEASFADDTTPEGKTRAQEVRDRLAQADARRADEKEAYDADARYRGIGAMDADSYFASRQAPSPSEQRTAVVAGAQAQRAEAQAADESAAQRENELRAELAQGVKGPDVAAKQAELAELAAARERISQGMMEAEEPIKQVQAEAEKDKDFFRLGDTVSGIWDAVKGLGVTAPAAFYQMVEGMERPDQYSESAKRAFAEADAFNEEMQAKTAANQAAGTSSSVGESFREAGGSLGFSLGSMAAAIPASIAGGKAGAAIGGLTGAAAGAPAAGVGAIPGAGIGATIGGVVGGVTAGMAASGTAAYRMAGAMFLNEAFRKMNDEAMREVGRPMNEAEMAEAYEALLPIAKNTGLWEAGPEAVGNAVSLGVGKLLFGRSIKGAFTKAVGGSTAASKPVADETLKAAIAKISAKATTQTDKKFVAEIARLTGAGMAPKLALEEARKAVPKALLDKVSGKLLATAGAVMTELATETITQVEQGADEERLDALVAGEDYSGIKTDWSAGNVVESFKEVAPQTLALMGLMGGAGGIVKGGTMAVDKLRRGGKETRDEKSQIDSALQAIDPEAPAPTSDELKAAAMFTSSNMGNEGLADGVLVERELAEAEAADTETLTQAQAALDTAKTTGGDVKAAEAAFLQAKTATGRAELTRAVLKVAAGLPFANLTPKQAEALGYKIDGGKVTEMTPKEREEAGVPERMIYAGPNGVPILTDAALAIAAAASPRARARVTMTEEQALAKAATPPAAAAAAPGAQQYEVTLKSGKKITVTANTEQEARTAAAGHPDAPFMDPVVGAVAIPSATAPVTPAAAPPVAPAAPTGRDATKPEQMTQEEYLSAYRADRPNDTRSDKDVLARQAQSILAAAGGNRASGEGRVPFSVAAANALGIKPPAGYVQEGELYVFRGVASPAVTHAKARIAELKAKSPQLAAAIVEDGERGRKFPGKIHVNPDLIIKEALEAGLTEEQAIARFDFVLDEEITHLAQERSAVTIFRQQGSPGGNENYSAWFEEHYGNTIWQGEFGGDNGEKGQIVRGLYTGTTKSARAKWDAMTLSEKALKANNDEFRQLAGWDGLEDHQKGIEAIRMMKQRWSGKPATEASRLWTDISQTLYNELKELLRELRKLVRKGNLSPALEQEIEHLAAALKQFAPRNPKADPKKPAPGKKGDGVGKPPGKGSDPSVADDGKAESSGLDGTGATLVEGQQVVVTKDGVRFEGVIGKYGGQEVITKNNGFRLMLPDGTSKGFLLDAVTIEFVETPEAAVTPEAQADPSDEVMERIAREDAIEAIKAREDVVAAAVDAYGLELPEGYALEGNLYVWKEPAAPPSTPPAKLDLEKLNEVRGTIIGYLVENRDVTNAIKNTPHNAHLTVGAEIREIFVTMFNDGSMSVDEYNYFDRIAGNSQWINGVVRDITNRQAEPATPPATPSWSDQNQKAVIKLKAGVAKAQRAENWAKVVSLIDQAEKDFNETNGFPDQWQDYERYREDAQQKIQRTPLVEPITKPLTPATPPPAVELTPGEQALKDAFSDMVDGLDSAPLVPDDFYRSKGIPREKRTIFMNVADTLYDEGVRTPEALAIALEKAGNGKLRPYSAAMWSMLKANYPELSDFSGWSSAYSEIDKTSSHTDIESQEETNEQTERDGNGGNPVDDGPEGTPEESPAETSDPNVDPSTGGNPESGGLPPGQPDGSGRSELPGGSIPTSDGDAQGGGNNDGAPSGNSEGGGPVVGTGVRDGTRPDVGSPEANFVIEDEFSMPKGEKARIAANMQAINLLRQIEAEGRNATAAEKQTLAKYSGWGSFKNAFNRINQRKWTEINERIENTSHYYKDNIRNSEEFQELRAWREKWGELHDQLAEMLSDEEFRAMSKSIRNAHYTALPVIDAMWSMVRAMGFKGGKVLETSAGAGYFVGRQPGDLANTSQWSAVELDSITSRIFSKLYPEARINGNAPDPGRHVDGQGFQKSKIPNNSMDLVIGNFPFAQDGPMESVKEFGKKLNLHNYFFARSIDKLKPGGIVIAITSNSTMDNNLIQRELIAGRVELVSAIRLPNNAFKESAGTEVTTDIIILRKKDGSRDTLSESWINVESVGEDTVYAKKGDKENHDFLSSIPAEWVPVDAEWREQWKEWRARRPKSGLKWDALFDAIRERRYSPSEGIPFTAPMVVNEYFARHPEMVIGRHALEGSMYRPGSYAVVSDGSDVQARLNEIVGTLPSNLFGEVADINTDEAEILEAGDQHREGSIILENDQPYHVIKGQLVPVRWDLEYAQDFLPDERAVKAVLASNPALNEEFAKNLNELSGKPLADWLSDFLEEHIPAEAAQKIRDKIKKETTRRHKVFKSWVTVRNAGRSLMDAELRGDLAADLYRDALNQTYDAHVKEHGAFSARNRPGKANPHRFLFDEDDSPLLESLEDEVLTGTDEKGKPIYSYEKRPIFTESMQSSAVAPTEAQDIKDAVGISMGYKGRISVPYMAELLKISNAEAENQLAESGLAFKNPKSGLYETSDTYLSGEVRAKLREAMDADMLEPGQFAANIEALKAVEPANRPIQSISIILGARWVPGSIYQKFGEELLEMDSPVIRYEPAVNMWQIKTEGERRRRGQRNPSADNPDYLGTDRMSAEEIFEALLNSREIRITKAGPTRGSIVLDAEATIEAQTKASQMMDKFSEWVKTTKEEIEYEGETMRVGTIAEREFNDKVAGLVTPTFTGEWVTLPGQSGEIWLKPHRKAVLARLLTMGYGMMAHGVGSGKTYNQIALAMELRRLGKARRPVTIVQNSTIRQFAASHMKAYPHAKILVADESNFSARKRARFLAKIATGDYDSVIMTHSNISQIGHDEQAIRNYMARAIGQLEEILASTESGSQEQGDIQAALDVLQEKLDKMLQKAMSRAGSILTWEQLGVDALIVDEAHEFKNAPIITRKQRIKNLPSGQASDRAVMMQIKASSVQANTGGKNVFFATGTPITNTMAEAYTMLNFIAPTLMESKGINNFDDFATMFGRTVTEPEATWRGEIELVERFARFVNGPELVALIRSVFDVSLGNEAMGLRVPKIKGGGAEMLIIEPTEASEIFNDWVIDTAAEFDAIENKRQAFEENPWMMAIPIMVMQAGMAQAIDPRLINPNAPDDPNSKVNQMVDRIVEIHKEGTERKTAQVVFTDLSNPFSTLLLKEFNGDPFEEYGTATPEMQDLEGQIMAAPTETDAEKSAKKRLVTRYNKLVEARFNLMDDIKDKLVAKGIPASEILLAKSTLDKKKLQASFDKVNSGEIRVIIGSTARLGVGVNIQERLAAAHNLSPPRDFKPAMMEQRIGRIERQGNFHRDWADQAFIDVVEKLSKQKFDAKKLEDRYNQAVEWLDKEGTDKMKEIALKAEAEFEVIVINYGLKYSMDSSVYSMMKAKQRFIDQVLMGENVLDEFDDPMSEESASFALMAAESMGDENLKRRVILDGELNKLTALRIAYFRDIHNRENSLDDAKSSAERHRKMDADGIRAEGKKFAGLYGRKMRTVKTTKGVMSKLPGNEWTDKELTPEQAKEPWEREVESAVYQFGDKEIDTGKPDGKITAPLNEFIADAMVDAKDVNEEVIIRDITVNGERFVFAVKYSKYYKNYSARVVWPGKVAGKVVFESYVRVEGESPAQSLLDGIRSLSAPDYAERYASNIEAQIKQYEQTIKTLQPLVDNPRVFEHEAEWREKSREMIEVNRRLAQANSDPRKHRYYRSLSKMVGVDATEQILGIDGKDGIPGLSSDVWQRMHIRFRLSRRGTALTPEAITERLRSVVQTDTRVAQSQAGTPQVTIGDFTPVTDEMIADMVKKLTPDGFMFPSTRYRKRDGRLAALRRISEKMQAKFDAADELPVDQQEALEKINKEIAAIEKSKYQETMRGEFTGLRSAPLRADSPEWKAMSKGERKAHLQSATIPKANSFPLGVPKEFMEEARDHQQASGKNLTHERAGFGSDANRQQLDLVTAYYDTINDIQTNADNMAEARRMLASNPKDIDAKIKDAGTDKVFNLTPADHVAMQLRINQLTEQAGDNAELQAKNGANMLAYRIMRGDVARVLQIGWDRDLKPAERALAALTEAIYMPSKKIQKKIASLPLSERKDAIKRASEARLAAVSAELAKINLKISDITKDNERLKLANSKLMKEVQSARPKIQKTVIKMIQQGASLEDIHRRLKVSHEEAQKINTEVREELRAKIAPMVAAGMTMEEIVKRLNSLQSAPLGAASALTPEQVAAEVERILTIGFGLPKEVRAKNIKPKKVVKVKPVDVREVEWSRPDFTENMNDWTFDTKDRAEIMRRVEIIRGLAGAIGNISSMSPGNQVKAMAAISEINEILAKYGTDTEAIFQSSQSVESYGFDINDINHVGAVARMISTMDADIVDKGIELIYANMLSGLQTMIVNATAIIPATWEVTVGRAYELALNSIVRDPMSAQLGEAQYILKGIKPAWLRAMSNFKASFAAQHPMFDRDVLGHEIDWDKIIGGGKYRFGGSISGKKGDIVRIPMRMLAATDDFNRTLMACCEVGTFAYRIGKARGMKPGSKELDAFIKTEVNTPGSPSYLLAAGRAQRAIFTNPLPGQLDRTTGKMVEVNDLGDLAGSVATALTDFVSQDHDNLFAKAALGVLRVSFFPFQRTPFNILRKGVRHTLNPFSLFDILLGTVKNSRKDNLDGTKSWKWNAQGRNAELVERMSQQLQGATLLFLLLGWTAGEGDEDDQDKKLIITGSSPYTPRGRAEREAQYRAGIGPYRISFRNKDGTERVGFNYGRLEPISTTLAATIDLIKSFKRANRAGEDYSQAAAASLGGFAAQAQDKSFMRGASDLVDLATNIVAEPDVKDNRRFQQFLASRFAMLFPNVIKQVIRETDGNFRERSDSFMQEVLYQVAPAGQKPAKIDPYGQEVKKTGNALGRVVDMTDAGTNEVNKVDGMLLRFRDKHPDKAWFHGAIIHATYRNTHTGEEEKMTGEQLSTFREMAGKRTSAILKGQYINYANPSEVDVKKVKTAYEKAKAQTKKGLAYRFSKPRTP